MEEMRKSHRVWWTGGGMGYRVAGSKDWRKDSAVG
jgi:hypothetical protein